MKERFTEEQIIGMLREHEAGGRSEDICRQHGIARSTFFKWKARCGGLNGTKPRG
jgi:putative transposase